MNVYILYRSYGHFFCSQLINSKDFSLRGIICLNLEDGSINSSNIDLPPEYFIREVSVVASTWSSPERRRQFVRSTEDFKVYLKNFHDGALFESEG